MMSNRFQPEIVVDESKADTTFGKIFSFGESIIGIAQQGRESFDTLKEIFDSEASVKDDISATVRATVSAPTASAGQALTQNNIVGLVALSLVVIGVLTLLRR